MAKAICHFVGSMAPRLWMRKLPSLERTAEKEVSFGDSQV